MKVWENSKKLWKHSPKHSTCFLFLKLCVIYKFKCELSDTGYYMYITYTMRHLHERVEEPKHKQSSICKHYMSKHGTIPRDLTKDITVLRKCKGLLHEMLFIQKEKPPLNIRVIP